MRIEKQIDKLNKEVWDFIVIDNNIYLNVYDLMKRESTRHRKYTSLKKYDRLTQRDSNLKENEVPFTDEIRKEALNEYFKSVKCLKWSERNY